MSLCSKQDMWFGADSHALAWRYEPDASSRFMYRITHLSKSPCTTGGGARNQRHFSRQIHPVRTAAKRPRLSTTTRHTEATRRSSGTRADGLHAASVITIGNRRRAMVGLDAGDDKKHHDRPRRTTQRHGDDAHAVRNLSGCAALSGFAAGCLGCIGTAHFMNGLL